MPICLLCVGSHGDVRPFVAVGKELKARGYTVWIATHPSQEWLCKEHGLAFRPVLGDVTAIAQDARTVFEGAGGKKRGKLGLIRAVMRLIRQAAWEQLSSSMDAVQGADCVLYSTVALAGSHLPELLGIEAIKMNLQPEPTREHPSCLLPLSAKMPAWVNRMTHWASSQLLWQPVRKVVQRWRQSHRLEKAPFFGMQPQSAIVALSPNFVPRPKDWGPEIVMTGFCRLAYSAWTPPEDLVAFLEAGPPPLYVGFGSLTPSLSPDQVGMLICSLAAYGGRVLLVGHFAGIKSTPLPPQMHWCEHAPHDWLFEQVDAVVHHGGIGTTVAALAAGRAAVVVPFLFDQFAWANFVYQRGLGPAPLKAKDLNGDCLLARLDQLSSYKECAASKGPTLVGDSGAMCTVEALEKMSPDGLEPSTLSLKVRCSTD